MLYTIKHLCKVTKDSSTQHSTIQWLKHPINLDLGETRSWRSFQTVLYKTYQGCNQVNKSVAELVIDNTKAFDSVDHVIIMNELGDVRIMGGVYG